MHNELEKGVLGIPLPWDPLPKDYLLCVLVMH